MSMLKYNETEKGEPSNIVHKITNGILRSLVSLLTVEIMKCKSMNVSDVKLQPSLSKVYGLCRKVQM
jgi:hypothetical protein